MYSPNRGMLMALCPPSGMHDVPSWLPPRMRTDLPLLTRIRAKPLAIRAAWETHAAITHIMNDLDVQESLADKKKDLLAALGRHWYGEATFFTDRLLHRVSKHSDLRSRIS